MLLRRTLCQPYLQSASPRSDMHFCSLLFLVDEATSSPATEQCPPAAGFVARVSLAQCAVCMQRSRYAGGRGCCFRALLALKRTASNFPPLPYDGLRDRLPYAWKRGESPSSDSVNEVSPHFKLFHLVPPPPYHVRVCLTHSIFNRMAMTPVVNPMHGLCSMCLG
jgi:hypothetical protein